MMSKWGKGLFTSKSPDGAQTIARVTMSKDKQIKEETSPPATDASLPTRKSPSIETTIITVEGGRQLIYPVEEDSVDYNSTSTSSEEEAGTKSSLSAWKCTAHKRRFQTITIYYRVYSYITKPGRLLHQKSTVRITYTVPPIPGTHIDQRFRNYSVFLNH